MIRIVLIDVGSPRSELNEPLGIENLAGKLFSAFDGQVDIKMFFLQLDKVNLLDFFIELKPHIVGISTKIGNYQTSVEIIESNLKLKKSPIIIVGDILSTLLYKSLLKKYSSVICVLGEGEDAITGIVKYRLQYRNLNLTKFNQILVSNQVPNLAINLNNTIIETKKQVVNLNIDFFPYRFFIKRFINNYGIIRAEASRGCPWNRCSFCYIKTKYHGNNWRVFRVEKVINEIIGLCKFDIQMIYYNDEDFIGSNPDRAKKIAELILLNKKKKLIHENLIFFISTSVRSVIGYSEKDRLVRKEILRIMISAGFREIFLGIESGSNKQLKRYSKGVNIEENKIAIKILLDLNADIDIGFIMFDSEMSINDLKENLAFIKETGLIGNSSNMMKTMRITPNTNLANRLVRKGLIEPNIDINNIEHTTNFQSKKIAIIHKYFTKWQNYHKQLAYQIQAKSRGQLEQNDNRKDLRISLGNIRKLNYTFLNSITEIADNSTSNLEIKIKKIYREFYEKNKTN